MMKKDYMNRFFWTVPVLAALAAVAGCSKQELVPAEGSGTGEPLPEAVAAKAVNAIAGADRTSLLLYFDDEVLESIAAGQVTKTASSKEGPVSGVEDIDRILKETGAVSFRRVIPYVPGKEEAKRKYGLHRWYEVTFPENADLASAAEKFAMAADVEHIQFNTKMSKSWSGKPSPFVPDTRADVSGLPFNDPMLSAQWHYHNVGDTYVSLYSREGADINVKDAWRLAGGDPRIVVAVVDEGVKHSHPDLEANMWINEDEIPDNGKDDDGNTSDAGNAYVDDVYGYNFVSHGPITWDKEGDTGHGTHVAGTIAAVNGNGIGVCGVAGGNGEDKGVRIMSCQIYDGDAGGTVSCTAEAFTYAADNGASVLQCSFGYPAYIDIPSDSRYEESALIEVQALKYFLDNAQCPAFSGGKGGLAIFAAGNDGASRSAYPAAYHECISVTSIGPDYLPAVYTNYGPGSNIAAPGGDISIGNESRAGVLSTIPDEVDASGSSYAWLEGTSMACPHVSGVAALGLSYALKLNKEGMTRDAFTSMLLTSVNDLEYYLNGTKDYSSSSLQLSSYRKQMGTGLVDTWKLLMQIEGTPCIMAEVGTKKKLDLDMYFGGSSRNLTYTGYEIDKDDRDALGLAEDPELRNGYLYLVCTKAGSAKITVNAIAGGTQAGGGDITGGIPVSKEVSIIARGVRSDNGGWL